MSSNVGSSGVYEAGDQRNYSKEEERQMEKDDQFKGKENSHKTLDAKDEKNNKDTIEQALKQRKAEEKAEAEKPTLLDQDRSELSKKEKVDYDIEAEEAEILAKKDAQGKH